MVVVRRRRGLPSAPRVQIGTGFPSPVPIRFHFQFCVMFVGSASGKQWWWCCSAAEGGDGVFGSTFPVSERSVSLYHACSVFGGGFLLLF
jgi:hypothetical protein